ncbi:MAG: hypothetical protein Q8L48_13575 [Archangium sp.]|nr:hypothetical protein [Archangium sp.]
MRTQILSFVFGLTLLLLAPACPTKDKCSAFTCSGCCDATGACLAGNGNLACGANGAQCSLCQGAQSCTFGVCGGAGAGGGNTGGGGGSGGGGAVGGGVGGGSGNPTVTQFCTDAITAQADHYGACGVYSPAGLAEQRAGQLARCNSAGGISAAYADGRATFDATAAASCLAAVRNMTCTNTSPPGYESCYAVFPGVVPLGGSCYSSTDCTSAGYCNTSMTCPGQCVARVALGQPATRDEQCPANAQAYGGVCVARIALGQSCAPTGGVTDSHYCVDGATCDASDLCVTRTPTLLQGNGQPCNTTTLECGVGLNCIAGTCAPYVTAGNACDSVRRCQWDLSCNAANVCAAPAAAGATCGSGTGCRSGLFCNIPTGMTTGTCATRRTVDQTCTYAGYECDLALFCTATATTMTGVCKAPYAPGAACRYDGSYQQCGAGYCTATSTVVTGVCANRKTTGASCVTSQECQSSSCTSGVCDPPGYCYDSTP